MLKDFDVKPVLIGKARLSGYRAKDFEAKQIFARYLGHDPLNLSSAKKKSRD